eukprot:gnl/MRDRNA2_/MRDRNA2_85899_c0_seq1.p1 gnl/MRDRNA2_/MRDRNA2_85899_c0~~gnl/MRDRNA2_/MRDRNA2_85899_c0_seq1.p1  ORF type:complete len:427 (+),score=104.79 gnl/MRDRNA2_/MRDRNA2_85899_c0_seq1:89-1369(+)
MRTGSLILIALACGGASALRLQSSNVNHDASMVDIQSEAAKPVFYIIVMGDLAYRHQVSLWLSSVRLLGGFKDEVVIVTDRPTCLAKTLQEAKLLGNLVSSTNTTDVFGPGQGYEGNVHLVKRPHTSTTYKMKIEKARAWANVEAAQIPHPVSSIIYTDEDIVIGRSLNRFLYRVRQLEEKKHSLALFKDTGTSAGELHTGIVVIFKGQTSDDCLQQWGSILTKTAKGRIEARKRRARERKRRAAQKSSQAHSRKGGGRRFNDAEENEDAVEGEDAVELEGEDMDFDQEEDQQEMLDFEAELEGIDQQSLAKAKSCKDTNVALAKSKGKGKSKKAPPPTNVNVAPHDGINVLPADMFWLPTPAGLGKGQVAEFVHFTNGNRWKAIKNKVIKEYLEGIGIPEHIDPLGTVKDKSCKTEQKSIKMEDE